MITMLKQKVELINPPEYIPTLKKLELIGRVCYSSQHKITDESYIDFIQKIIKSHHDSILEHESITVKFTIDRGIANELTRHRLCSFAQSSTRYIKYNDSVPFIIPSICKNIKEMLYGEVNLKSEKPNLSEQEYCFLHSLLKSSQVYQEMMEMFKWKPQYARMLLPLGLACELNCTANIRQWRYILQLRTSPGAHPELIDIMNKLKYMLIQNYPRLFKDLHEDG